MQGSVACDQWYCRISACRAIVPSHRNPYQCLSSSAFAALRVLWEQYTAVGRAPILRV